MDLEFKGAANYWSFVDTARRMIKTGSAARLSLELFTYQASILNFPDLLSLIAISFQDFVNAFDRVFANAFCSIHPASLASVLFILFLYQRAILTE